MTDDLSTHPLTEQIEELCDSLRKKSSKRGIMTDHSLTDSSLESYYKYGSGPYDEDQMRAVYDLGKSEGRADMLKQVIEWISTDLKETYIYAGHACACIRKEDFLEDIKAAMRPQEES
jgi:hypothetical protein